MTFTYDCPECGEEMKGTFGEDVYCKKCNITYETDCDLSYGGDYSGYNWSAWIVRAKEEKE